MQGLKPGKYIRMKVTDYRKARRALARQFALVELIKEVKKRKTNDPVLQALINQMYSLSEK